MKRILFMLIAMMILLCCACQPTPENKIIVSKGETSPTVTRSAVSNIEQEIPKTLQRQYITKNGMIEVDIQAEVVAESQNIINQYVFAPGKIESSMIRDILFYLFGEGEFYQNTADEQYTKSEIEAIILELKRAQAFNQPPVKKEQEEWSGTDEVIQGKSEILKYFEKQYEMAPEEYVSNAINQNQIEKMIKNGQMNIMRLNGKKHPATFQVDLQDDGRDNILLYKNMDSAIDYSEDKYPLQKGRNLNLSIEKATKQVEQIIDACHLDMFRIDSVFLSNKYCTVLADAEYFQSDAFLTATEQCYVFRLTRVVDRDTINDVLSHDDETDAETREVYAPVFRQENIEIALDDTGIIAFKWKSPIEIEEHCEQKEMLPLETVVELFMEQMERNSIGIEKANGMERKIKVGKIKLGYMQAIQKDSTETGTLMPVWDFYANEGEVEQGEKANYSLLTINATDGSIVHRGAGY